MPKFPNTLPFVAMNRPIRIESSVRDLDVEGTIPPEVKGAFFRAVPDPAHPPLHEDDITLSADGMVSRFLFADGQVDHDIRYVNTHRYAAERKARKALYGNYRNPFTDDPSVRDPSRPDLRTVSNTTPVWHAGRLFMTKEDGRPYEINPHTLETVGYWDYDGKLRSLTLTAHPRIDPATGEMFTMGYEAGGLATRDVAYVIIDRDGNLKSEQWFQAPYVASIHDFVLTEKYVVFPIYPTTSDLERMKQGGAHWAHQQDLESWVGVMPRYGKVSEMRWFKGPKGVSAFHMTNGFDDGDKVHFDACLSDTNAFYFMREAGGIHRNQWELQSALTRWTLDLGKPGDAIVSTPVGPPGDLPRIRDADQGRPYNLVWLPTMNPQAKGPPLVGNVVGACFNLLLRIDLSNPAATQALVLEPNMAINEPVHVPGAKPGHNGWLLAVVDRQAAKDYDSELWIIDADNIAAPPVAKVKVPVPLRPQVHGWWVSAQQLEQSRRR
ncbi:MAG TPA: carotenoid oxygenase family protein [Steroidobacteraceae bacterium]|nr:carotenoid oxygenase family protein [Steroidobacteraceae bacterium]